MLSSKRLLLRPWKPQDAELLFQYASDPRVALDAGWPAHTTLDESRAAIRDFFSAPYTYAIVLRQTGDPVGSVGLLFGDSASMPLQKGEAELGYWLGVPYWGQGIAPEACALLLRFAFRRLGLKRIWCGHYDGNLNSRRVQQKCGFVPHHTNPCQLCPRLGIRRTAHYAFLTRRRWRLLRLKALLPHRR